MKGRILNRDASFIVIEEPHENTLNIQNKKPETLKPKWLNQELNK